MTKPIPNLSDCTSVTMDCFCTNCPLKLNNTVHLAAVNIPAFFFRSRLCPQSCLSARSCALWTWETTACRRCRHVLENSPGWPSWSWEGTVLSVSRWSSGSVGCWSAAGWWWRRTCSTRCHQKSRSSSGGRIKSKPKPSLRREFEK